MTVIDQYEFSSTLDKSVNSAPEPTEVDVHEHQDSGNSTPLVRNMIDDFLQITELYDKLDKNISDENTMFTEYGSEIQNPEHIKKYLEAQREKIVKYIKQSVNGGSIEIKTALLGDEFISDADYAELHFEDAVEMVKKQREKALAAKVLEKTIVNPAHISTSDSAVEDEASRAFLDILVHSLQVKAEQIKNIAKAALNYSGAIPIQTVKMEVIEVHDEKALFGDPNHADEVTVSMRTVKP